MEYVSIRNFFNTITIIGAIIVAGGGIGQYYYGNLAEKTAPLEQKIHTAYAEIEIIIKSKEIYGAASPKSGVNYNGWGGYLNLIEKGETLLTTSSENSTANRLENNKVQYTGEFKMNAQDPATNKKVKSLKNAEYAEIEFTAIQQDSKIIGGSAIITINNNTRLEIDIPKQITKEGKIIIKDLSKTFSKLDIKN